MSHADFRLFIPTLIEASVALQNRYVKYFEKLKISYQWTLPARKMLMIKRFILYSIHGKCLFGTEGPGRRASVFMFGKVTVYSQCLKHEL